ncbi:MAG: hypothetical protein AB1896_08195 [Thermodesulfobacteriota bacterium]
MRFIAGIKRILSSGRRESGGGQEDILEIARAVEGTVDRLVSRVFSRYGPYLLDKEITYIVPAVWGAAKDKELTAAQREIHQEIHPALTEAQGLLGLAGLRPAQEFAVGYILRSLVISKFVYMVEATRRRQAEQRPDGSALDDIEPVGTA